MERLESILIDVREKGFPELKDYKIKVFKTKDIVDWFQLRYMLYPQDKRQKYTILANPLVDMMPEPFVVGGFAHELEHLVYNTTHNIVMVFLNQVVLNRLSSYLDGFERRVDEAASKRGFVKEIDLLNEMVNSIHIFYPNKKYVCKS